MEAVFVLQFSHRLSEAEDSTFLLGIYRTRGAAVAAFERLKQQPGFHEHPRLVDTSVDEDDEGFHIDEFPLDQDHWTDGFVTVRY